VRRGEREAVLKVYKPGSDELNSVEVLKCYGGHGAVWVLEACDEAVLLERIKPGTELSQLVLDGRDDKACEIYCKVSGKLHSAEFDAANFDSLSSVYDAYGRYLLSGDATLSRELVEDAQMIFKELMDTQKEQVLLHGDLHHDNILYDEERGWLAIDPKGYIGEREWEVSQFLKNPKDPKYFADEDIIKRRIGIISGNLGLDGKRVLKWAYSTYVANTIWGIEDGIYEDSWMVMMKALREMV
jgi:streptomycin 6-kinase